MRGQRREFARPRRNGPAIDERRDLAWRDHRKRSPTTTSDVRSATSSSPRSRRWEKTSSILRRTIWRPVDEFHSGGRNATVRLAQLAQISNGERVLDVGCGIGGPSRYLASQLGCQVIGLDFTAEFVALAEMRAAHAARQQGCLSTG